MTEQVKHNGCAVCKSKDQEILVSVMIPGQKYSQALCDKCRASMEVLKK